jgi:enamine deaminase RidA (YjgF/YER057c/UK114 family)
MKRESVNSWDWGLQWSMDQGQLVEGVTKLLHCSGQVALEPNPDSEMGIAVMFPGDIRRQMQASLANIDAVLKKQE